jgi:hypothetical protein
MVYVHMFEVISNKFKADQISVRFKTFTANKCHKILSGDQLCQIWVKNQRFTYSLCLHHQDRASLQNVGLQLRFDTAYHLRGFYSRQDLYWSNKFFQRRK